MKQSLYQAFHSLEEKNPPQHLESLILQKIEKERNKQVKIKMFASYSGSVLSLLVVLYAGIFFGESFLKSDFWNIVSLMFSDIATVAQYWKDYAMSLLETFPIAHVIMFLAPIFTLLLSLNLGAKLHRKYGLGIGMKRSLLI